MGYIRHDAIIVTSCFEEHIQKAHKAAHMFFNEVSALLPSKMNGYLSFFIPPDGSMAGWEDSEIGDGRRANFIEWVRDYATLIGWNPLEGVIVNYAGDSEEFVEVSSLRGEKFVRHQERE